MEDTKNSQQKFAEMAKCTGDFLECINALYELTDQTLIMDVAKNAELINVRVRAVERITDETLLVNIAETADNNEVRFAAAEKLTDDKLAKEIYADIAVNGKCDSDDIRVRQKAISQLTDQELLFSLAKTGNNQFIREEAVKTLTDVIFLTEITNGSEKEYICTWEEIKKDEVYPDCYMEGCYIPACGRENCDIKIISYPIVHNLDLRDTARRRLNDLK